MVKIPLDIPDAWQRSAARILSEGWHRILVVGATDRGKSSYCKFLVNALLQEGQKVSFVDADIGQKDVGPPATVTLADFDAPMDFAQAPSSRMYFVGHVSPFAHFLPLVVGTRQMVEAARIEFVVIDTAGLVQGRGRVLAGFQIESLHPDVLVCLEWDDELAPIRHAARHCNILRLRPSRFATRKSAESRRQVREEAFRAHFQGGDEIELKLDRVTVQRCSLFNGTPVADPRFIYAESFPDGLIAVAGEAPQEDLERVQVLPRNFADQLLCGVLDKGGNCIGLAIIGAINFSSRSLMLYTPIPKRQILIVQFGDMYLDQKGRELRLGRLGQF
jgi:polynucleotide 5'-hydroxyl-kinase GRC3/NOL9